MLNIKYMYDTKKEFIGIRIANSDKKRLEEIATSKRLTLSSYIRMTLASQL